MIFSPTASFAITETGWGCPERSIEFVRKAESANARFQVQKIPRSKRQIGAKYFFIILILP